jgi:protein tyrosine phosphatase (PTP) superfamily phosphohydrolase (DUF442 family)
MDILNWRRIDDCITTSGQPTEEELVELANSGVKSIINLGPHSNDGALEDEPASVAALGMRYIYIPVDFSAPTRNDFDMFCDALKATAQERVHVHCIYNARVSAFFYLFAKEAGDADVAFTRMDGIWRPGGVWAKLIGVPNTVGSKNLYAGYEYMV